MESIGSLMGRWMMTMLHPSSISVIRGSPSSNALVILDISSLGMKDGTSVDGYPDGGGGDVEVMCGLLW